MGVPRPHSPLLQRHAEDASMTARMRSRITDRTEKGLGPISFKRLLIAGGTAAIASMLLTRLVGFFPGCLSATFLFGFVIALTQPIEGIVLATLAARLIRSHAAIAAWTRSADDDDSDRLGPIPTLLQVAPDDAIFDANATYDAEWDADTADVPTTALTYLGGYPTANKRGLRVTASPFSTPIEKEGRIT